MTRATNASIKASTSLLLNVDIGICFMSKSGIFSRGEVKWQED